MLVIAVVLMFYNQAGLLAAFLAWQLAQQTEIQSFGRRLPGQFCLDSSKSCVQSVCYLQQQVLLVTKGKTNNIYITLAISLTSLVSNSKGGLPYLVLGFCQMVYGSWGGVSSQVSCLLLSLSYLYVVHVLMKTYTNIFPYDFSNSVIYPSFLLPSLHWPPPPFQLNPHSALSPAQHLCLLARLLEAPSLTPHGPSPGFHGDSWLDTQINCFSGSELL